MPGCRGHGGPRSCWAAAALLAPQLALAQPIKPVSLAWSNAPKEGYQCIQATTRGDVFLFRGDRWAVQAVTDSGALDEPSSLRLASPAQPPRFAALSPEGDRWIVLAGQPRLFLRGEELPLAPLPFIAKSAAFVGDIPVVQVAPGVIIGENPQALEKWREKPPWLVAWQGGEWDAWAFAPPAPQSVGDTMEDSLQLNDAFLLSGQKGLLAAFRYVHRYWVFASQGRLELAIERRGFQLPRKSPEEAEAELGETMKREGFDAENAVIVHASRLTSACLGIARHRDGTVFAVMGKPVTGAGPALERWDPRTGAVRAVPLDLAYDGVLSLACGKKGLYLAAFSATKGRWFIPWELLENAGWGQVDVEVKKPQKP